MHSWKIQEIFEASQAKHNIKAKKASIVEEALTKAIERHKVCQQWQGSIAW
jgi:hypothetical protein